MTQTVNEPSEAIDVAKLVARIKRVISGSPFPFTALENDDLSALVSAWEEQRNSLKWQKLQGEMICTLAKKLERTGLIASLVTIRQVIDAGDEAIAAVNLNPFCMNEGTASGDERIDDPYLRVLLAEARAMIGGDA